jgi:hypothetical protein
LVFFFITERLERRFALFGQVSDVKSAAEFDFSAIFLKRRAGLIKDATRDATSAAPSVSPPRAVL